MKTHSCRHAGSFRQLDAWTWLTDRRQRTALRFMGTSVLILWTYQD